LTHTWTEGTQDDAHGLTDVAVPCFESLLVGQDLSLGGSCSLLEGRLSFSLNHSRCWCGIHSILPVANIVCIHPHLAAPASTPTAQIQAGVEAWGSKKAVKGACYQRTLVVHSTCSSFSFFKLAQSLGRAFLFISFLILFNSVKSFGPSLSIIHACTLKETMQEEALVQVGSTLPGTCNAKKKNNY